MITPIIFTILLTNLIINCFPATGNSSIKRNDQLNFTSQLVSPGNNFTLGFFTIPATNYIYLGIWYTSDQQSLKVWVANPSTPIISSSSVLMIDPDTKKLIILSTERSTLVNISDNESGSGTNLTANLEDTGNFQLKDETDNRILWQSFDHPTNVLLPGMKLGSDLKTGQNWNLTSWTSDQIPAPGAFTLSWEPNGKNSQRLLIRLRGLPYWTSGNLDDQGFEFMSVNELLASRYNLSYVYNNEERYFSFSSINYVHPMWILRPQGRIVDGSNRRLITTDDQCYGFDMGNGCVASSKVPSCRSERDQFSPMSGEFSRELTSSSLDDNISLSISDCMVKCWNDCGCLGYMAVSNGTGCVTWTGTKSISNFSIDTQGNTVSKYVLVASNQSKGKIARIWIWAPIVAGFIVLSVCFGLFWYLKDRKIRKEERQNRDDRHSLEMMVPERFNDLSNLENGSEGSDHLMVFSFASILIATNEFSIENKLGQGGFGPVYKGKLSDEREIAIKRLSRTSGQGLVEFKNELLLITKLQHTNLVRVLGCCVHEEEKMLIYEYMPNKSLDFFLFDETKKAMLDWPKRWKIIEGIAQGLLYLHRYSRMRVIHRDLKASNVLLDENMNPKISDFGMARIFKQNETEAITKRVVGTYGYMSPEYAMEGAFSEKSDVFSFGVLILEVVSGRKNSRFIHLDQTVTLVSYAWELWQQGDALQLEDATLTNTCVVDQLLRIIHVALLCVQENAVDRPLMSDVISMLINVTMSLPTPKRPAYFFNRSASTSGSHERKSKDYSINKITITEMEAR
ncbi:G-type lectin S-receptor-like serine/threonine-protein kinase CES101 [Rutidosis leptorrhynchoides]|uniref:G-type lectin S-receptor-like serine/threonine-protein kinase CES101 n=1 Tax=Rutidosis leptorrhynchoides TaxID=125765 RepID=UPI003A99CD6D